MGIFKKFHNYILHCSSLSAKLVFSVLKDSFFGSNSWQLQIEKKGFQTKSLGCCVSILLVFQNGPSNLQQAFPKKKHRYHFPWIEKPLPHTHPRKTSILNSKNGWFGWMFRLFHFGDPSRKDYVHLPAAAKRVVQLSVAAIRQVDPRSFRQKMLRRSLLFVGDFP